jgi:hypothetical protein
MAVGRGVAGSPDGFSQINPARHAMDIGERRPDGVIKPLQAEVGGDEAIATVNANSGTNEHAIDIDDVGLQHREFLSNSAGQSAAEGHGEIEFKSATSRVRALPAYQHGHGCPFLVQQAAGFRQLPEGSSGIRGYISPEALRDRERSVFYTTQLPKLLSIQWSDASGPAHGGSRRIALTLHLGHGVLPRNRVGDVRHHPHTMATQGSAEFAELSRHYPA